MKVLLLFPMADGQTGPAIKHAFENLGHTVKSVDAKIYPGASYLSAHDFKPDLVFCSRTATLVPQILKIRAEFKHAMVCTWLVDTRTTIDHWKHLFPLITASNYFFIVASRLIPEWKKINPNTFWLPQGLQDEIYGRPKIITDEDRQKYLCDVSFAGSSRDPRGPFLDNIEQMNIHFKKWGNFGQKIYNEEHNKMVALSKINLACSGWPENEKTTSVRNYKIMGAGGFLLELYRKGIYEIFPEDTLDCYKTPEDLAEKIRYWLDHEEERKEIAASGYKWIHENATYTHRIEMALDYMKADL